MFPETSRSGHGNLEQSLRLLSIADAGIAGGSIDELDMVGGGARFRGTSMQAPNAWAGGWSRLEDACDSKGERGLCTVGALVGEKWRWWLGNVTSPVCGLSARTRVSYVVCDCMVKLHDEQIDLPCNDARSNIWIWCENI